MFQYFTFFSTVLSQEMFVEYNVALLIKYSSAYDNTPELKREVNRRNLKERKEETSGESIGVIRLTSLCSIFRFLF